MKLDDMKHLMRFNDFNKDALSGGHPVASVCARGDLAAKEAVPKGCYDTKVCCWAWLNVRSAGPVHTHVCVEIAVCGDC